MRLIFISLLILLLSISLVQSRYQFSIPFIVDKGTPVSSATVGINISTSNNCKNIIYRNQTISRYGRGQINISSPLLIESKNFFYCWNATVSGVGTMYGGPIAFQVGVGEHNESRDLIPSANATRNIGSNPLKWLRGWYKDLVTDFIKTDVIQLGNTNITAWSQVNKTGIQNNTEQGKIYLNLSKGDIYTNGRWINQSSTLDKLGIGVNTGNSSSLIELWCSGSLLCDIKLGHKDSGNYITFNINPSFTSIVSINNRELRFDNNIMPAIDNFYASGTNALTWKNVTSNKYVLGNGSSFDVIYGRDTNNQTLASGILKNNTNNLINETLLRLKTLQFRTGNSSAFWNITANSQTGDLGFYSLPNYTTQLSNTSKPFSNAGCFRINSGSWGSNGFFPGSVHIGTTCTQGYLYNFIDLSENVNVTSLTQGLAISLSQTSKNIQAPQLKGIVVSLTGGQPGSGGATTGNLPLQLGNTYTGAGGAAKIVRWISVFNIAVGTNDSKPVGEYRVIDLTLSTPSLNSVRKIIGFNQVMPTATTARQNSIITVNQQASVSAVFRTNHTAGLWCGKQGKSAGATLLQQSYCVEAMEDIGLGNGVRVIWNMPFLAPGASAIANGIENQTRGNISMFYDYAKNRMTWGFGGRQASQVNMTFYNQRQFNLSFADAIYINDTAIFGNYPAYNAKIDSSSIFLNKTAFSNTTITAKGFLLNNGSNFNVIYGRDTGIANNSNNQGKFYFNSTNATFSKDVRILGILHGGSPIRIAGGLNITSGNLTFFNTQNIGIDCSYIKGGTDTDFCTDAGGSGLSNNSATQGKIYFNSSIFSTGIINAKYALFNNSLFDVIYGRFNNTWAGRNIVYNNTIQSKIYFNNSLFSKGNLTFIGSKTGLDCSDIIGGDDADFCTDATGAGGGATVRWTVTFVAAQDAAGFLCTNCPAAGTEFFPIVITNMTNVKQARVIAFCDVACDADTVVEIIDAGNTIRFSVAGPNAADTAEAGLWTANALTNDQSFNVRIKGTGAAAEDYRVTNIYLELMT